MLKQSFQNYDFQLGTTSYIYPFPDDNLIANVKSLKDHFDKIQLLFFGKEYLDDVMNKKIISQLIEIRNSSDINFSVHLPLDLNLMSINCDLEKNISIIKFIMKSCEALNIKEYILHLEIGENFKYKNVECNDLSLHQFEKVLKVLKQELSDNKDLILLENNDYDLTFFKDIIIDYNFSICMDVGHLEIYNFSFKNFLDIFGNRIKEIHFHGSLNGKDHQSAEFLKYSNFESELFAFLKNYKESLIIEVFNEKNLVSSLEYLRSNIILS